MDENVVAWLFVGNQQSNSVQHAGMRLLLHVRIEYPLPLSQCNLTNGTITTVLTSLVLIKTAVRSDGPIDWATSTKDDNFSNESSQEAFLLWPHPVIAALAERFMVTCVICVMRYYCITAAFNRQPVKRVHLHSGVRVGVDWTLCASIKDSKIRIGEFE